MKFKQALKKIIDNSFLAFIIIFPIFLTIHIETKGGNEFGVVGAIIIIYPLTMFITLLILSTILRVFNLLRYLSDKKYKKKVDFKKKEIKEEAEYKTFYKIVQSKYSELEKRLMAKEKYLEELNKYEKLLFKWIGSYYHSNNSYSVEEMEDKIRQMNNVSVDYSINSYTIYKKIADTEKEIEIIKEILDLAKVDIRRRYMTTKEKNRLLDILDNWINIQMTYHGLD